MSKNRNLLVAVASAFAALVVLASAACAQGGANSFFGANGGAPQQTAAQQTTNPYADPSVVKGDFTADEKRMQKKYVESIAHAKALIARGAKMMADGSKRGQDKLAKKGKVFKEIGEKRLAELQANNPLGDLIDGGAGSTTADKTKVASPEAASTQ
jgi:hypothetical protein